MTNDSAAPVVIASRSLARTALFDVQEDRVRFGNGVERRLERIEQRSGTSVMVVPVRDGRLLFIREYCAGTRRRELAFPTGTPLPGEAPEAAARRELREEVGLDARRVTHLATLRCLPGHLDHLTVVLLAEGLFASPLPGDEPEPPELAELSFEQAQGLLDAAELTEARSVAALLLARQHARGPWPSPTGPT